MCGIAFWSKANYLSEIRDANLLAAALLREIESRGRDAAGAAWHDPEGSVWWQKQNIPARDFNRALAVPKDAPQGILHTRWATLGTPKRNGNNHPIVREGIVLVHNGHVHNHAEIFRDLQVKREHEVDSEAIAAAIYHGTGPIRDRLASLRGNVSALWMNVKDDVGNPKVIHVARCWTSPLVIGRTKAGDTIGASTQAHLVAACRTVGITLDVIEELPEWTYLTVSEGKVTSRTVMVRPPLHHSMTTGSTTTTFTSRGVTDYWDRRDAQRIALQQRLWEMESRDQRGTHDWRFYDSMIDPFDIEYEPQSDLIEELADLDDEDFAALLEEEAEWRARHQTGEDAF